MDLALTFGATNEVENSFFFLGKRVSYLWWEYHELQNLVL